MTRSPGKLVRGLPGTRLIAGVLTISQSSTLILRGYALDSVLVLYKAVLYLGI